MGEGDWTNVIIPGDATSPGFTHLRSYLISGLLAQSQYECLVQARNRFGWSDPSRLFTFLTSTKGGKTLNVFCVLLITLVDAVTPDLEWRSAFTSTASLFSLSSLSSAAAALHLLLLFH